MRLHLAFKYLFAIRIPYRVYPAYRVSTHLKDKWILPLVVHATCHALCLAMPCMPATREYSFRQLMNLNADRRV